MKKQIRKIPLQDFFRNPEKVNFELSPNGAYLSFLAPYKDRLNIFVQPTDLSSPPKRITSYTDRSLAGYSWLNDNYLTFVKDNKGDENYHVYAVDQTGQQVIDLTPFEGVRASIVDDLEEVEDEILVSMNKRDKHFFDVYRINVITGAIKMVAKNPGNIIGWLTDHDGNIRIGLTSDGVNTSVVYRENDEAPFRTITTFSFKETFHPLKFTPDNKYVYAISNIGRDKTALVLFDIAKGSEVEEIYSHPTVDVTGMGYSRKRKKITYAYYITDKVRRTFFDKEYESLFQSLQEKLATNNEIYIVSKNKEEDKMLVVTTSDRSMGTYYFYDLSTDSLSKLADTCPWHEASELAEMKPISYSSRDGLTIHGYLTLPNGVDPKNLPVIINPHGGPWVRDVWGFSPEVQFLANRGYAVLQMNYRGSTGYGRKFWETSFKQWGYTMQDDITDGVNWLIEQGIADPTRVAIYGASYGGYATLAGLTFTPDLYACGIDFVGVSNLFTFLETMPSYWELRREVMYEQVGHPEKDKERLAARSPSLHADKIKAPLFIAQGAQDPRVKKSESDQMVAALKERGIDVQYMVKENEGHGFRNVENKFEFYKAMETFLEKHLKKAAVEATN